MRCQMTDKIISLGDFRKKKEDFSEDSFPDFDDIFGDIFEEDFDDELPSENPFTIGDNLPLIDSIYQEYLDSKRLLENGRAAWLAQGPHGWLNLDERDYLALACNHATIAKQMCLYDQALAIFQEIYQLDTNDPLGLRYQLMATYLLKQDWQALQAFFDSQDYFAEDEGMLVYMTIASLFQDKLDATKDYLDRIIKTNANMKDILFNPESAVQEIIWVTDSQSYLSFSRESILVMMAELSPVMTSAFPFILGSLRQLLFANQTFITDSHLNSRQIDDLMELGFYTIQDLSQLSEKDFLALPGFGKAALAKIKQDGALFKQ